MRIIHKIFFICFLFIPLLGAMLFLLVTGVNSHIEFAELERAGIQYQTPLEDLLEWVPLYGVLTTQNLAKDSDEERLKAEASRKINEAFARLKEIDARYGVLLQFTDEGLQKRNRSHARADLLEKRWVELEKESNHVSEAVVNGAVQEMLGVILTMIQHVGDTSNLILDPDLDSYYLMDVTLLGLPFFQRQIFDMMLEGKKILAPQKPLSFEQRLSLNRQATSLHVGGLDRAVQSAHTSLNEDPNFYGVSPSLQRRLPLLVNQLQGETQKFLSVTDRLVREDQSRVPVKEYWELGHRARWTSFDLWKTAIEELDQLLLTRIASYKRARFLGIMIFVGSLVMGGVLIMKITLSILNPLKAQAAELQRINRSLENEILERKEAERKRNLIEIELRHAQKMEAIGRLAAGIAHEINTPTQYIGDNVQFLKKGFEKILKLLKRYEGCFQKSKTGGTMAQDLKEVEAMRAEINMDYLVKEMPTAIDESLEGIQRVTKIVRAMKDFSHPGTKEKTLIDLNQALSSTATVARNEWKYIAELVFDLDPKLPLVPCLPGEINQVFLNLIVNAAHAIGEKKQDGADAMGRITISTRQEGEWVEVHVEDTGKGIHVSIQEKIYDPFITTKPPGKGTGQGLAIVHAVVVDNHGGMVSFRTEEGRGTTFLVRLPLKQAKSSSTTNREVVAPPSS